MKETRTTKLNVRVPAWLPTIESMTEGTPLRPDRLRAIIHQFFLAWIKDKRIRKTKEREDHKYPSSFFAVNSELLKEIGSEHYAKYVHCLESWEVIYRKRNKHGNSSYVTGSHSTLYRWIVPSYVEGDIPFRSEIISDRRTLKSILRSRDNHVRDKVRLPVTVDKAMQPIFEKLKEYTDLVAWSSEPELKISSDEDLLYFEQVYEGSVSWSTVCEFGNRYHTPYTILPKKFRGNLRFTGREDTSLILLDFANSQPFFSSIMGDGTLIERLAPEFLPVLQLINKIEHKKDFILYKTLCREGRLYQHFTEDTTITKEEIKKLLFKTVLFSKKKLADSHQRNFRKRFANYFPSVVVLAESIRKMNELVLPELHDIIKPRNKEFKSKNGNDSHKIVPALMQRLESRIIFRHIVPAMLAEGIGPFLTIHDAFIVLPEHAKSVKQIIAEVFLSFSVQPPLVRDEVLSQS